MGHKLESCRARHFPLKGLMSSGTNQLASFPWVVRIEQPFFENGKLTPPVQARVDFYAQFTARRPATKVLCDKLVGLDLLSGQEAMFKPEESGK